MKTFYVLIDRASGLHFGWTFDEQLARAEADDIERRNGFQIDIYEFLASDEFKKEC